MSLPPGTEFVQLQTVVAGRYSLERELGRGGMGMVFLARDVALDRPVAIKLLPLALAAQPSLRERFLREARTAARLSHPNIVPIHLVEEQGDVVFFVMMYVEGESLGQRVRRAGPLTPSQAAKMMQEVAWALAYAHGRGVVHRDIKPDNILLDRHSGRALVTDFGIARVAETETLSDAGALVGTAHYMSPEQATGEAVDGRSDLFSLSVTTYYALTGKLPFEGPNIPAVVMKIVSGKPPALATQRPELPAALVSAVERGLAKQPAERFTTGEELAEALGAAAGAPETPPQIRHLVRTMREAGPQLALLGLAAYSVPALIHLWNTYDRVKVALLCVIIGAGVVGGIAAILHAAAEVVRAGFSASDVRRALERIARSAREEAESVGDPSSLRPEQSDVTLRRARSWQRAGNISLLAGMLAAFSVATAAPHELSWTVPALAMVGLIFAALTYGAAFHLKRRAAVSPRDSALLFLGWTERLLATRFTDVLFRLAGRGIQVGERNEPPATERTELLLAAGAGDVWARLPTHLRARFEQVPEVLKRLERDAQALREREQELARALLVQDTPDLVRSRHQAQQRLATTVAALEGIRLDLLRLEAGAASADDLTANLARAAEIANAIDAQLYGQSAAEASIRTPA